MKLFLFAAVLLAHDWYPQLCCRGTAEGGDCHPVPCDSITELKDGYEWDHVHFAPEDVHPSLDKECHACVQFRHGYCLFILPTA